MIIVPNFVPFVSFVVKSRSVAALPPKSHCG